MSWRSLPDPQRVVAQPARADGLNSQKSMVMMSLLLAVQGLKLPGLQTGATFQVNGLSRRDVLAATAAASAIRFSSLPMPAQAEELTTKTGEKFAYTVVKSATTGGSPIVGDLIAIRFKCAIQKTGAVIDNILESTEPYYYRVGSGQVLPAVEAAVVKMKSGEVWDLVVPPELGFGTKGRSERLHGAHGRGGEQPTSERGRLSRAPGRRSQRYR